jgi:hypothetical protein
MIYGTLNPDPKFNFFNHTNSSVFIWYAPLLTVYQPPVISAGFAHLFLPEIRTGVIFSNNRLQVIIFP